MKWGTASIFDKWDKGEYVYPQVAESVMKVGEGKKIGRRLSNCTICPVGNATCTDILTLTAIGICPNKDAECAELMICSLGVHDIDHCPLSK